MHAVSFRRGHSQWVIFTSRHHGRHSYAPYIWHLHHLGQDSCHSIESLRSVAYIDPVFQQRLRRPNINHQYSWNQVLITLGAPRLGPDDFGFKKKSTWILWGFLQFRHFQDSKNFGFSFRHGKTSHLRCFDRHGNHSRKAKDSAGVLTLRCLGFSSEMIVNEGCSRNSQNTSETKKHSGVLMHMKMEREEKSSILELPSANKAQALFIQ